MADIEKVLPVYYKKSQYMLSLCQTNDKEFDRLYTKMDKFENNLSIDDADESGVKAFEGDFNIKTTSDIFEIRKKRVKAKFLGTLPTTEKNLLNSIQIFDENAYIVKHINDYSFEVCIQNPEMLLEIMALIEDIKPAHLAVSYSVTDSNPISGTVYYGGSVTRIQDSLSVPIDFASNDNTPLGVENIGVFMSDVEHGRSYPAQKYNTFEDIKNMTYEETKNKTYAELLYKEV